MTGNTYLDLALIALITVYIVDLSGFTDSWRGLVARFLHTTEDRLKPLPPFDCSLCMVWWTTLIYTLATEGIDLLTIAYCAGLSFLAFPMSQAIIFIREALLLIIRSLSRLLNL